MGSHGTGLFGIFGEPVFVPAAPRGGLGKITTTGLMLLVRDGQKDAIVDRYRAFEERRPMATGDGDVIGVAAQRGSRGFRATASIITRLERDARRLRRAVHRSETGIADEHLAVAAVDGIRRRLG